MDTYKVCYEDIRGQQSSTTVDAPSAADAVKAAKEGDPSFLKLISAHKLPGGFTCSTKIGLGEDSAPDNAFEKKPWQSESASPVPGAMDGVPFGR